MVYDGSSVLTSADGLVHFEAQPLKSLTSAALQKDSGAMSGSQSGAVLGAVR